MFCTIEIPNTHLQSPRLWRKRVRVEVDGYGHEAVGHNDFVHVSNCDTRHEHAGAMWEIQGSQEQVEARADRENRQRV